MEAQNNQNGEIVAFLNNLRVDNTGSLTELS